MKDRVRMSSSISFEGGKKGYVNDSKNNRKFHFVTVTEEKSVIGDMPSWIYS
jgi:hypothetical protein